MGRGFEPHGAYSTGGPHFPANAGEWGPLSCPAARFLPTSARDAASSGATATNAGSAVCRGSRGTPSSRTAPRPKKATVPYPDSGGRSPGPGGARSLRISPWPMRLHGVRPAQLPAGSFGGGTGSRRCRGPVVRSPADPGRTMRPGRSETPPPSPGRRRSRRAPAPEVRCRGGIRRRARRCPGAGRCAYSRRPSASPMRSRSALACSTVQASWPMWRTTPSGWA